MPKLRRSSAEAEERGREEKEGSSSVRGAKPTKDEESESGGVET